MVFILHDNLVRNAEFVIRQNRSIDLILRLLITQKLKSWKIQITTPEKN